MERQRQQQRQLLERIMDRMDIWGLEAMTTQELSREVGSDLRLLGRLAQPEDVFFPEHGELYESISEMLEHAGLAEACMALARLQEEERDHWIRRLKVIESHPRLRARRMELDREFQDLFTTHFRHYGAPGVAGDRSAEFEAAALLGALRAAERMWLEGNGRPVLPVLVHEALALLWPALYPHQRKHR
jgi:MftR C-terminal domain